MPRLSCLLLSLLLLPAAASAAGQARPYTIDPTHSRIVFSVSHDGFSNALGSFSRPEGELWFDPKDWRTARVTVRIDLSTLDLGDTDFNARIARPDYLDATAHPQARFVSERVEPRSATEADVHGQLSLRGVQRPITLRVRLNRIARSAYTLRRTVGFSAAATLSRSAFGLRRHASAVGDDVALRIEVEAVRTPADR